MANYKTNIVGGSTTFANMMEKGFGIVTVMNAKVYNANDAAFEGFKNKTAYDIKDAESSADLLCEIKTLKIANVSQEGPTKTVTGGQFSNPLIKFGKSARLEMQDALGRYGVLENLYGANTCANEDILAINDHIAVINKFNTLTTRDFRGYLLENIIKYLDKKAKFASIFHFYYVYKMIFHLSP